MPDRLIIGAMSGTSADGVDVAAVAISGRGLEMSARLLGHCNVPYEASLKCEIFQIRDSGAVQLARLAQVGRRITLAHATAVKHLLARHSLRPEQVEAIAAHGQTLFHNPPNTIQWFDPALLASETGCTVVSDFRRADCAAGGQGAPLVPFADYILFRDAARSRMLLNLGGIANLTFIRAGARLDDVLALDTGPGNCISDWLCRTFDPGGPGYDVGGETASTGIADEQIIASFMADDLFAGPVPRSTDPAQMIARWEALVPPPRAQLNKLLATACGLTIDLVAVALARVIRAWPDEVIVSGGGVHNRAMMQRLAMVLDGRPVRTSDELGMPAQAKEAVAFALLGAATLDGVPSNVTQVTGAARPMVLGSITPGRSGLPFAVL